MCRYWPKFGVCSASDVDDILLGYALGGYTVDESDLDPYIQQAIDQVRLPEIHGRALTISAMS